MLKYTLNKYENSNSKSPASNLTSENIYSKC